MFDVGVTGLPRTCQTRFHVSKLLVLSSGCITHHRTVMSSCRSCPGAAVSSCRQATGQAVVRRPGSSPLRHVSADLEPGSESERRDLQDDAIPEPHLDLHDNECGQEGRVVGCRAPGGRAARLLRQQTSQLSAFHQTLAAWPAIPGPGLAGE